MELRASIATDAGRVIEVALRDLSFSGCRIQKPDYAQIPDTFRMSYIGVDKPDVEATVVWRRGNEVGARFLTVEEEGAITRPAREVEVQKLSLSDLRRIAGRG